MGNRSRANRTKNPLLVCAAAITRACDPKTPSRITVLRLLGDALHTFQESQLVVDEIKARAATQTIRHAATALPRAHLEADARVRSAHEHGARALFTTVTAALIKLPCRGGPLRRRAADLLEAAGRAAGPAVVMQAAETLRDHILSLKRLTWSDTERGDFEVVCAIMTLADVSSCAIAGRDVAKDSVQFLMTQRVRQKCRRGDVAIAIAVIVQSFPQHAPPDDRMVDQLLDLCLSPSSLKQGTAGVGSALLVALVVPHLASRGPVPADEITATCAKALQSAPAATERAMWAVAMARASVTARRSTTYQLRKYGNSESGSKFPSNSFNRLPQRHDKAPEDADPKVWVSNETFEESLVQVASASGLSDGRIDSFLSIAGIIRMWGQAIPESIPVIVQRTFSKLLPSLTLVSAVSALVDGIWLGLLKDLKPSQSPSVFESLLPVLAEQSDMTVSAVLHICSSLLFKFGRQCLGESGLTVQYKPNTVTLIKKANEALDVPSHFVRMGGVRLMSALIATLPRTASQFLTTVLQNLRIADLTLATKTSSSADQRTFGSLSGVEHELSSILGNAAALSTLIEKIASDQCCVPTALVRQCAIDGLALLRPHQAGDVSDAHGVIAGCIRRRAGWGLIAALARAKRKSVFEENTLFELVSLWKEDLGFAGQRTSRNDILNAAFSPPSGKSGSEAVTEALPPCFDELTALSATRSAALNALAGALQHMRSGEVEEAARALVGACAARIIATQTSLDIPNPMGSFGSATPGDGITVAEANGDRKHSTVKLARVLARESAELMRCVSLVPPRGDSAELCYIIALSLGEEAQKVTGEQEGGSASDYTHVAGYTVSQDRLPPLESALTNYRPSLSRSFYEGCRNGLATQIRTRTSIGRGTRSTPTDEFGSVDSSWMFSMQGTAMLLAEDVLVRSAVGIAAIVAEDLSASGSLVESLSAAKLSPCFSAVIALEISRRLSRSDLAEINRALAVLQVLANRSLAVTAGYQRVIASDNKTGRMYVPNMRGDSCNFSPSEVPGAALQKLTRSDGWLKWARTFCDEGLLAKVPFHDFHTRCIGISHASRLIAAEAHRELGTTGGPTLWIGLMRKVIAIVRENMRSPTSRQSVLHSNAIAALGALLEVVPEPLTVLRGSRENHQVERAGGLSEEVDQITDKAFEILADSIENGNGDAQIAAALSLSDSSHRVASSSDRFLQALLKAWAHDKGEFSATGQIGRCLNETEVWAQCFQHIWKDMGIRMMDSRVRFFSQDSCGTGACSPSLVAGAAAVLSSCRLHWWALSESSYSTATEMSTELLQWAGPSSRKARAAALYGMVAIWAAKTDAALTHRMSDAAKSSVESLSSFGVLTGEKLQFPAILPVQAFSLKEPTKIRSAVGPFLDEILYEALAPRDSACAFDELHSAGTASVMEIVRGAGVRETCLNLPRLPESLFATVEAGSTAAQEVLDVLVKSDGKNRPRYWFGLCRAVCLDGDRLNFGAGKCSWDVTYQTKAAAVEIAVEALDSSLESCACDIKIGLSTASESVKHECAYGFLRKVCNFAEELCGESSFDFVVCGEGCKLIQVLASRIGSAGTSWSKTDRTLCEFRDIWDSVLALMERMLDDKVPLPVVNNAGLAVSELLVSFLRLRTVEFFGSAQGRVASFLDRAVGRDVSKRFSYADQGEEVGLYATLALVANYAKVITTMQACAHGTTEKGVNGVDNTTIRPTRELFFAIVGDFVSTLHGAGLRLLARHGGALTPGMVSESQIQEAMAAHLGPIVLGAISCVSHTESLNASAGESHWTNGYAAGVGMARSEHEYDGVALGCFVWLTKHEHEEPFSRTGRLSFSSQCQEAVISLCCMNDSAAVNVKEVLLSYAQWDKMEYFQFVSRISTSGNIQSDTAIFVVNLALTTLGDLFQDELDPDFAGKSRIVSEAVRGLLRLLSTFAPVDTKCCETLTAHVLDTVFHIIETTTAINPATSLFADVGFQGAVCSCLSSCLHELGDSVPAAQLCLSKVKQIFWYGCKEESLPHVKISMAMGATMCGILSEDVGRDFVQLLLTPVVLDADEELSIPALSAVLDSHGVEKLIIKMLCNLAQKSKAPSFGNVFTFVYQLGRLGFSKGQFCIPAALRSSIAAIRVEDPGDGVINKIGLVLYSIFLSKLVRDLPRSESYGNGQLELNDSAKFLVDLARHDAATLQVLASSLTTDERDVVKLFLRSFEHEGQTI